jgi:hypothetical protein
VISDHRRREESGHLEPAVTVRRTHHGNLNAHAAQSSDAICPVSLDWGAPLELETKFGEELYRGIDIFYHDTDVIHTLDGHVVSLASRLEEIFSQCRQDFSCDIHPASREIRQGRRST